MPPYLGVDPETEEPIPNPRYVAQAGAKGAMKYIIGLKSWREKDMAGNDNEGGWSQGTINFYEFSFTAETFLTAISTGPTSNHDLLLLPANMHQEPEEQEYHPGIDPEQYGQL